MLVITFAIEIGQWATGTGAMEFADITAGVLGFLAVFCVFAIIRALIKIVFRKKKRKAFFQNPLPIPRDYDIIQAKQIAFSRR